MDTPHNPEKNRIQKHKKFSGILNNLTRTEVFVYTVAFIAAFAAIWPMLTQGVTLNDELQNRFDRKIGFWFFVAEYVKVHFEKGRVLSLLMDFRFLGFLSNNMFINRCVCATLILGNAFLIAYVIYRLCKDRSFSIFAAFLFVVLMPLSFQHTAPAAFTPLVAIPMFSLGFSFINFIDALESKTKSNRNMILSAFWFFCAMNGYEFMITYAFLFPVIYIYLQIKKKQKISFFEMVRVCRWHIGAGILFLVLYFALGVLFTTSYSGNQLGFVSLQSSLKIIFVLFLSAIPGYYCFNYLAEYLMWIHNNGLINGQSLMNLGVTLIAAGSIITCVYLTSRKNQALHLVTASGGIVISLVYMVLPSVPNSLSTMYQGMVTETFFTSLPVSYFLYTAAIILIAQLAWILLYLFRKVPLIGQLIVCVSIVSILIPQQAFNHVVSRVQTQDYHRLETIEGIFETNTIQVCNNRTVWSNDIYESKNLLAIHDGYWNRLASLNNLSIDFIKEDSQKELASLFLDVGENSIVLWDSDNGMVYVLSRNVIIDKYYMEDPNGNIYRMPSVSPGSDGEYYVYVFLWNENEGIIEQLS